LVQLRKDWNGAYLEKFIYFYEIEGRTLKIKCKLYPGDLAVFVKRQGDMLLVFFNGEFGYVDDRSVADLDNRLIK
jgi:hypothetical protein